MTTTVLGMKRNRVHVDEPNRQSLASLVLLCREYSVAEFEEWMEFKETFLDEVEERTGSLSCTYCPKTGLKREVEGTKKRDKRMLATVDHVVPLAKGGAKLDPDNCVVACATCNEKKADTLIEC